MDISIVIPLFNEEESLPELIRWIKEVMSKHQFRYEVILVDDGSRDKSWDVIKELAENNHEIRGISFRRNYGKSAALNEGFKLTQGDVIITMDADLQDSPEEIPELYNMVKNQEFDLVSGWKKKRYDPLSKTIPTKIFNWATRKMSGIKLHDFNCGLKAYSHEVVKSIEIYGEMHRYVPVLAKSAGFKRISEKAVHHQPRKFGSSKFGFERFTNGLLDLMTITFMAKFGKRPMHFFGTIGIVSFLVGFIFLIRLICLKLYYIYVEFNPYSRDITERPSFYIALTVIILGTVLFLAGFLGEMVARANPERNNYMIKERL